MTELPELIPASLGRYLDLREEWLACKFMDARYSVSTGFATREEAEALQSVILDQMRELHRLRLVFLGNSIPSMEQWMLSVIQAAESDPDGWAERRRGIVMLSMEMPGDNVAAVPAEPVDRVTQGYREILTALTRLGK